MKLKVLILISVFFALAVLKTTAQKKIKLNEPIPLEYLNKNGKVYLDENIEFVNPKLIILADIYGPAYLFHGAARKQQKIKEEKISKEKAFKNDSVLVIDAIKKEIFTFLKKKGVQTEKQNNQTECILNLKVYDHGFHWASSSAAGLFLRIQAEILSIKGEQLWTMVYTMTKDEAKTTHKRGGMTLNKCIDKCIADFEQKPELLSETYQLIAGYLAEKIITIK